MMENNGCVYSLIKLSPVDVMMLCRCYETEFRSLKKLLLSLSVFAIMLLKRLPDGSEIKKWLPG